MTTLKAILTDYLTLHTVAKSAADQYRHSLALYSSYLGHDATTDDLDQLRVSEWIASLETRYAPTTVSSHRDHIRSLWRFAAERGDSGPYRTIRVVRVPDPLPRAWTPDELRRLLDACLLMRDPEFWRCEILVGYETGLRRIDCQRLSKGQVVGCTVTVTQHKTGKHHVCQVRPETADLFRSLPGDPPLRPRSARSFWWQWAKLRRLAGVTGGAHQQLRRTGATEVAIAQHSLQAAREWLGHRNPRLVDCYVDRSRFHAATYMPPPIRAA